MLTRLISEIRLEKKFGINIILLLLGLALFPFLILSFYCHPSADDFWLTNMVIAKGPWQAQADIRQNWSGRYTSMFLGSFNPLVFRSFWLYQCLPIAFLFFLVGSLYYLVRVISRHYGSWKKTLLVALLLVGLYLYQMPTVAQTIYWMSGAITYQAANILLAFFLAVLYRYYQAEPNKKTFKQKFLITFLLFATIGCNETTMAIAAFFITCLLLISFFRRQIDVFLIWLVLVTIVASCLVIWAPGNAIRSQEFPLRHDLGFSLFHALLVPINNSLNWLVHSPILLATIIFIPFIAHSLPKLNVFTNVHPVVAFIILYGCLASGYFVAYWSKHGPSPPRAQDTIYFVFLIGWFLNVLIFVQFLSRRFNFNTIPHYVKAILTCWGFLILFYGKQSNIRTAYIDLFSGRAYQYNQEMQDRYKSLATSTCQVCPIQAARNRPQTIFFEEVTPDTTWENTYYARYFGKKLLLVSE